jgi:hypothetical protein
MSRGAYVPHGDIIQSTVVRSMGSVAANTTKTNQTVSASVTVGEPVEFPLDTPADEIEMVADQVFREEVSKYGSYAGGMTGVISRFGSGTNKITFSGFDSLTPPSPHPNTAQGAENITMTTECEFSGSGFNYRNIRDSAATASIRFRGSYLHPWQEENHWF